MCRCYLLKVELLGSCTKELFIGGINIHNISTKGWSNLNEEIIQQFRNFYLIARFLSLVLNFVYYCFIRLTRCQFIYSFPGLVLITGIIIKSTIIISLFSRLDFLIYLIFDFPKLIPNERILSFNSFIFKPVSEIHSLFQTSGYPWGFGGTCAFSFHWGVFVTNA